MRKWKTLSSKIVYENPWIKLHEDKVIRPDGKEGTYAYLEKRPGVHIIAQDKGGSIFLVNEFRYPIKKSIFQLPSGAAESDDFLEEAKKELFEETGITAKTWKQLGHCYHGVGQETTIAYIFLANDLDLSKSKTSVLEEDTIINKIIKVSPSELKKMINNNQIEDGIALAALSMLSNLKE